MPALKVMAVGDGKEQWLSVFLETYGKKLKHFCDLELVAIKPFKEARHQVEDKLKKEGEAVLKQLSPTDYFVLCDLRGTSMTSEQWATKLENIFTHSGKKRLCFLIGGAFGVDGAVFQRADLKIKLSDMTMNHHVALAMLLEQIYRAFTIRQGIPYHNG